jgi:hypothetical protein
MLPATAPQAVRPKQQKTAQFQSKSAIARDGFTLISFCGAFLLGGGTCFRGFLDTAGYTTNLVFIQYTTN